MKYLNITIDKPGLHCKCFSDHRLGGFCVGKFYVLNEIFQETGLVLITDLVSFKTSYLIFQNLKFTRAKFLLCSKKHCQCKSDLKSKMLCQVLGTFQYSNRCVF